MGPVLIGILLGIAVLGGGAYFVMRQPEAIPQIQPYQHPDNTPQTTQTNKDVPTTEQMPVNVPVQNSPVQKTTPVTNNTTPSATIDKSSLTTTSSNPTITGTAKNTTSVTLSLSNNDLKCGALGDYNMGISVPVVNGKWSWKTNYNLAPCSDYGVGVSVSSNDPLRPIFLDKGTLSVNSSASVFDMSTYNNSQYGFSIQYPSTVQTTNKATYSNPFTGVSKETDIFQATYKGNTIDVFASNIVYKCSSTNSVGTVPDWRIFDPGWADAGLGQEIKITSYRTLHGNMCYMIIKTMTGVALNHLTGTELQQEQVARNQISAVLDSIVLSFRFTR